MWPRALAERLTDRILAQRDAWLASPRFQRWAARRRLLRPIASRRASELFDLCAGFVYSQVLYACVRLRVFGLLKDGPLPFAELAQRLDLTEERARRLVDSATALSLLEDRGRGRVGLGVHGAALLGNPGVMAMIEHHRLLYADLADPVALLRAPSSDTALRRFWAYAGAAAEGVPPEGVGDGDVAAYSTLMTASQPLVADDVLDTYSLAGHRCLMDVGGGEGRFLASAAARHPHLRGLLFDLPAVAERAALRFSEGGLAGRVRAVGGDFHGGAFPTGADVISLVRVAHDHDDADVMALFRAAHAALPPGGALLLAEPLAGIPVARGVGTYFQLYLLAMGRGRPRTAVELQDMLREAGFRRTRLLSTPRPLLVSVLVANRD